MLRHYLHVLEQQNPCTMTHLDIGLDERFEYLFVALGATRFTYPFYYWTVIVRDGTHLESKKRGILFVAVTKDAKEHVYHLAWGLGLSKMMSCELQLVLYPDATGLLMLRKYTHHL